jgi:glycosyltransferase involved in cell wall biosynthesis
MLAFNRNDRFCLIPLTNSVSGTERIVADITRSLHAQQASVDVVLPADEVLNRMAKDLQPYTDSVIRIGTVTGKKSFGKNLLPAIQIFRRRRPSLIHFHCPHYRWGLDVLLAANLSGVPCLVRTEHNPLMASPSRLAGMLLRMADRRMRAFTYVSRGNQRRFEQHLPYRVGRGRLIENGIEPTAFSPTHDPDHHEKIRAEMGFPRDCKIAISVGSYGDRRSLRTIFEAFQLLLTGEDSDLARQWRLLIVGTGPKEESDLPAQLGIQEFVHFAGQRRDVAAILPHCDLFVTSSAFEGMSIAILEAWAANLLVLATQVDGISDIIGDEAWSRLTVRHNDVAGYARNWLAIMNQAPDILAVHTQASTYVRSTLTSAHMIDGYLRMYQQFLK